MEVQHYKGKEEILKVYLNYLNSFEKSLPSQSLPIIPGFPDAAKWCLATTADRWSPGKRLPEKTTSNSFLPAPINNDTQAKLVASQAHLVLPLDVASLVFLYEMGDGKDS